MKRNEKIVIQGNEFYVIDLDCLEKKGKYIKEHTINETTDISRKRFVKNTDETKNDSE